MDDTTDIEALLAALALVPEAAQRELLLTLVGSDELADAIVAIGIGTIVDAFLALSDEEQAALISETEALLAAEGGPDTDAIIALLGDLTGVGEGDEDSTDGDASDGDASDADDGDADADDAMPPLPIIGTEGNDFIEGSEDDDIISARAGNDFVLARRGDDEIVLSEGDDVAIGWRGADEIRGQDGDDIAIGDSLIPLFLLVGLGTADPGDFAGNLALLATDLDLPDPAVEELDRILDLVPGDPAGRADALLIGDGDIMELGAGDDVAFGEGGNDVIEGGEDRDLIFGGVGDDELRGNEDTDVVLGDVPLPLIAAGLGLAPDDPAILELKSAAGNDRILGGGQSDLLIGNAGNDELLGGSGADLMFGDNAPGMVERLVEIALTGNDDPTIGADDVPVTLDGVLDGEAIDVSAILQIAEDDLFDRFVEGSLFDDIRPQNAPQEPAVDLLSLLPVDLSAPLLPLLVPLVPGLETATVPSDDLMFGDDGDDLMFGEWGDDVMYGGAGTNAMDGGRGRDELHAGSDENYLRGGFGADTYVVDPAGDTTLVDLGDVSGIGVVDGLIGLLLPLVQDVVPGLPVEAVNGLENAVIIDIDLNVGTFEWTFEYLDGGKLSTGEGLVNFFAGAGQALAGNFGSNFFEALPTLLDDAGMSLLS